VRRARVVVVVRLTAARRDLGRLEVQVSLLLVGDALDEDIVVVLCGQ